MNYAIKCGNCGHWQGYQGHKSLRLLHFNCFKCGKSKKIYNKKTNIIQYSYKEVKETQNLSRVVAFMNEYDQA